MRLLYVINGLGTGGAERSLAELLPYLGPAGIETTIVVLVGGREGIESDVVGGGYDVRFLRASNMPSRIRALRRLVRNERPDVIHTTHFEADVCGRLAAVGTGIPVLTSLVNTPYDPVRRHDRSVPAWKLRMVRAIDTVTARRLNDRFHAISHAVKAAAVERMGIPPERVTVVERGRDATRLGTRDPARRRRSRRALGLHKNDEVVLNVGRREFQKGQRWLIEAVDALADERPRLVLLVAGRDGLAARELDELRGAARHSERIRFLGHRSDVPELLAAADVFAFPSLYEGLGGSVIEAMAMGLPVVASDIPALREVVDDGASGLLTPPGSSHEIVSALRKLLDDAGLRTAMGVRGRAIFEERYRVERMGARMVELYRSLTGDGSDRT
jgi:glycosyltransferase involved in cell wall biosynthesis